MHHSTDILYIINYHFRGCCINIKYSQVCNDACPVYTTLQLVSRGHTWRTIDATMHKSISQHRTLQHWYDRRNHYSMYFTLYTIQNTSAFICIQLSAHDYDAVNHEKCAQARPRRHSAFHVTNVYISDVQNNKYEQPTVTANDQNIWQPLLIK